MAPANRATNNATPTISGTTDEPVDTAITVKVDTQMLTTTAGAGGVWSVTPATLSETSHSVVASVEDAAGNTGTARQILTVDKTKPVVRIKGGAPGRRRTPRRGPTGRQGRRPARRCG